LTSRDRKLFTLAYSDNGGQLLTWQINKHHVTSHEYTIANESYIIKNWFQQKYTVAKSSLYTSLNICTQNYDYCQFSLLRYWKC
jgi:hypothetical protein